MGLFRSIKNQWDTLDDRIRELSINTKIEIYGLGAAFLIAGTTALHVNEDHRSSYQEASFSEYEQIEDEAIRTGTTLPYLWWHQVGTNEYANKVFEANNLGRDGRVLPEDQRRNFAVKLEQAMDTTGRIHRRNMTDFARMIPNNARGALEELQPLRDASARANNARSFIGDSWSHTTYEETHTEYDTSCSTDEDGDETCTTTSREVCDYIDHFWTPKIPAATKGLHALSEAKAFLPDVPTILLPVAQKTEAWNEQVIREAFRRIAGREPSQAEMLERAQRFIKGSQYVQNQPTIRKTWREVTNEQRRNWGEEIPNMKYTTHRSHACSNNVSGPRGYELAQEIEAQLTDIVQREQAITIPIAKSIRAVPEHFQTVKEFFLATNPTMRAHITDVNPATITRSEASLERATINGARTLYIENIPGGNEPTGYRLWLVILGGIASAAIGAGLGVPLDNYTERKWGHLRKSRRQRDEDVLWGRDFESDNQKRTYRRRDFQ